MAHGVSEYTEEYCGLTCNTRKTAGERTVGKSDFQQCHKSLDEQPVGGRLQTKQYELDGATRLPACDEDFVSQVYGSADRGTHRVEARWKDPRWSDPLRCNNCILYEPTHRDPPNRGNWYLYRSTVTDPLKTPCQTLTVPDVHKLRYLHNNYMTTDDWY